MRKRIVFLSEGPYTAPSPLPFHLLKGFAETDPDVKKSCEFLHFKTPGHVRRNYAVWHETCRRHAQEIVALRPDLIALSLYVWSTTSLLQVAAYCRELLPEVKIIAGGPDTFGRDTAQNLLRKFPQLDYVLPTPGGGELAFQMFLQFFATNSRGLAEVPALRYRTGTEVTLNPGTAEILDLDKIPSGIIPHAGSELICLRRVGNNQSYKTVVVETSRSCPVGCSYCQYAVTDYLAFGLDRILAELEHIRKEGLKHIYFADGIFTLNKDRALVLFDYFLNQFKDAEIHCEAKLDILPNELLSPIKELLSQKRLWLGIGLQSSNPEVLKNIHRKMNFPKFEANARALAATSPAFGTTDLIFGLPGDSFEGQLKDIDYIYSIIPRASVGTRALQVLPGTTIRDRAEEYGIQFSEEPFYEVTSTPTLTEEDIWKSKQLNGFIRLSRSTQSFYRFITGAPIPRNLFHDMLKGNYFDYIRKFGRDDIARNNFQFSNALRQELKKHSWNADQKFYLDGIIDFNYLQLLNLLKTPVDPECLTLPSLFSAGSESPTAAYRYRFPRIVTEWPRVKKDEKDLHKMRNFLFLAERVPDRGIRFAEV